MSIFWDPRSRKPRPWIYLFFILLTAGIFLAIYNFGSSRASKIERESKNSVEEFK